MNTITKEIILERLNRFKNRVDELGGTTGWYFLMYRRI